MPEPALILLHGIRGATLAQRDEDSFTRIWSLAQEFHPRSLLLALQSDEGGRVVPMMPEARIFAETLEDEIYGPFLNTFQSTESVLAPPFDWRLAPAQALESLAPTFAGSGSLNLVTHSMGLFVLLEALRQKLLDPSRLARLVLVTPPFCGSADIVSLLARGIDSSADGELGERRYDHCLARSFPSLYRLLPGVDCAGCSKNWLDASSWHALLAGDPATARSFFLQLSLAREDRLAWQEQFRDLCRRLPDDILLLAGTGVPTQVNPEQATDVSREGDGRLLVCSTRPPDCPLPRVVLGSQTNPVKHGEILTDARALDLIARWLRHEPLPESTDELCHD